MKNTVQINKYKIVRDSERAILLSVEMIDFDPIGSGYVEFEREAWIPKSQIYGNPFMGEPIKITEWLAKDRGLMVYTRPGCRIGRTQAPA